MGRESAIAIARPGGGDASISERAVCRAGITLSRPCLYRRHVGGAKTVLHQRVDRTRSASAACGVGSIADHGGVRSENKQAERLCSVAEHVPERRLWQLL